jgi:hypothetical protein
VVYVEDSIQIPPPLRRGGGRGGLPISRLKDDVPVMKNLFQILPHYSHLFIISQTSIGFLLDFR